MAEMVPSTPGHVASLQRPQRPQRPQSVLVTGARGQVGRELVSLGAAGVGRGVLDLSTPAPALRETALRLFDGVGTVINAAAYTDVDGAEDPSQRGTVEAVNASAPGVLAAAAAEVGAHFLHISTDYVFPAEPAWAVAPGNADPGGFPLTGPEWPATDQVEAAMAPNVYGRTKALGEVSVRAAGGTVVRTAWVWSGPRTPGRDFVATMAELAAQGVSPQVVDDQTGRPTYAPDLAAGLWSLSQRPEALAAAPRTLHFTNSGAPVTWCGLAREVFQVLGHDPDRVNPCTSGQWPAPARRPAWSVLDLSVWRTVVGEPPLWTDALRRGLNGT